jgi:hypothetical protein
VGSLADGSDKLSKLDEALCLVNQKEYRKARIVNGKVFSDAGALY